MSKIWYCATCGYEVGFRGRCHQCRQRLVQSPLPELPPADEDDEVGYRLDDWSGELRGQLITNLITEEVLHRFEEDELVVAIDDEDRVDALVAALASDVVEEAPAAARSSLADDDLESNPVDSESSLAGDDLDSRTSAGEELEDEASDVEGGVPEGITPEVIALAGAAALLEQDPTNMEADQTASESSTSVFLIDEPPGVETETWNAVGRTTRKLMAALNADEALEDEIRLQAGVLHRLLMPIVAPGSVPTSAPVSTNGSAADAEQSETVYELGEWLPEQRAELALRLDEEGIVAGWDGANLVVSSDREDDVEAVLDRIEAVQEGDADEEATYRAMEELFAATNRFMSDPSDRTRGNEVVRAVGVADGPTPFGLDDAQWWQIRQRARILADSIEHKAQKDLVVAEARTLRDLLRGLM